MSDQDKLLPCPFCGGDGWVIDVPDTKRFRPQCSKCGAGFGEFKRKNDAIAAWNAREKDVEDARRYRWLRDTGGATWMPLAKRHTFNCALPDAVDEAIDIAMNQRTEGEG